MRAPGGGGVEREGGGQGADGEGGRGDADASPIMLCHSIIERGEGGGGVGLGHGVWDEGVKGLAVGKEGVCLLRVHACTHSHAHAHTYTDTRINLQNTYRRMLNAHHNTRMYHPLMHMLFTISNRYDRPKLKDDGNLAPTHSALAKFTGSGGFRDCMTLAAAWRLIGMLCRFPSSPLTLCTPGCVIPSPLAPT